VAAAANPATPRPGAAGRLLDAFDTRLPFRLTEGQQAVGAQLAAELSGDHPMQRLLQGEVGSGKTVVALRAMLQVVEAGGQAALLAPTEKCSPRNTPGPSRRCSARSGGRVSSRQRIGQRGSAS
jgi:ATP-dependent DNA helicase RecG